jgi:Transglycosylase SLT domain
MPLPLVLGGLALAAYLHGKGNPAGASQGTSTGPGGASGGANAAQPSQPAGFDALFQSYGAKQGVPWKWLKALCMNESSLGTDPRVARGLEDPSDIAGSISSDGKSWGLMQLTIPTACQFEAGTTAELLNDPEISVRIAAKFVAWIQDRFDDSDPRYQEWVVKSYNQGVGNTNKEIAGTISGYAGEYWSRFQRNLVSLG